MEREDLPPEGEQVALLAPVDLTLRTGEDLEPAKQPAQVVVIGVEQLVLEQRPHGREVHLHPLVMAGEAVISHQALVDDASLQRHIATQPRLDQSHERDDDLRLSACS